MTAVGLFGKLPAHGDFVRRGLPPAVTTALDEWLQGELSRLDGTEAMRPIVPLRFAATTLLKGHIGLGALVGSGDSVGRDYVAVALRLSAHPLGPLPAPIPPAWDDWCVCAEAILLASCAAAWTADATQAALEATVLAVAEAPLLGVADDAATVAVWRPRLAGDAIMIRSAGMPSGETFDRLLATPAEAA